MASLCVECAALNALHTKRLAWHPASLPHARSTPWPWPLGAQAKARLVRAHAEVVEVLAGLYVPFQDDSEEVQREWVRFTQKVRVASRVEGRGGSWVWQAMCMQLHIS